jgi:alkanesulfonate monooxygenase SsuD/methylene tetrahydromethanopterin reductase-like flavin-dependent oxidoreductase (luciferase family)
VDLHRQAAAQTGHEGIPVSINSHTYVADTTQAAADEFFPAYAGMMNRIGRERGWSPMSRPQFDALRTPQGALLVGSPPEVAEKILAQHELFGHERFMGQMSVGALPHDKAMRSIELFGTEVAPIVREALAAREPEQSAGTPA